MRRYTLIVDGNYFLHKTFFISGKIKSKKDGPLNFIDDPQKDSDLLAWKLATDFAYEVKRFAPILDGIVYCIDSSSWRKDFYPESNSLQSAESQEYKGHRKKDNTINWKLIYELHDKFAESLKTLGCTVSRVSGAEADDLIFAWSSYLNMNNRNALIFSGDNDLIQLVCNNEANGTNTLFYNKFSKSIYSFEGFTEWLSETNMDSIDIFNQPLDLTSNTKLALQNVVKGIAIKETNVNEFIFRKILMGDAGDNVSPLYQTIKKGKDGKQRVYNITDSKANQILEDYEKNNGPIDQTTFFSNDSIVEICKIAKNNLRILDKNISQLVERYETNRNLMFLHQRAIPSAIMEAMLTNIETSGYSSIHNMNSITKDAISEPLIINKKNTSTTQEASFFGGLGL
jgi:5'-3' exonuclease